MRTGPICDVAPAFLDVCIEEQVPSITFSFGDASKHIARTKQAGILVMHQVQTIVAARESVAAGVDIVIAQGGDAGRSSCCVSSSTGGIGNSGVGTGTGGTGGTGTAVMNPPGCLALAPTDNGTCSMSGLDCTYGMTDCTCEAGQGGGGMPQWNCSMGGQNTPIVCPPVQPMSGGSCVPGSGNCMFGGLICDCINDTDTWARWDPADCPATQPAEQAACNPIGMECPYGGGGQGGNTCDCTDTGWDCGTQFCPATEPAAAGTCEGGDGVCTFGGRVCDCDSRIWACWNVSDCPATPPVIDSACPLDGMICDYGGGSCECGTPGWDCDNGVGSDADAGM